ncbi:MAG: hypothetical protein ABR905_12840 [Terracidiphilus sp.]|jgi:hypothetical protein
MQFVGIIGQPTVIGAGNDADNYLDSRKERMTDDQGTAHVDHSLFRTDFGHSRPAPVGRSSESELNNAPVYQGSSSGNNSGLLQ